MLTIKAALFNEKRLFVPSWLYGGPASGCPAMAPMILTLRRVHVQLSRVLETIWPIRENSF
jgi:hypothetical protein